MKQYLRLIALLALASLVAHGQAYGAPGVTIGSKAFTESVILGEILVRLAEDSGVRPVQRLALGGTRLVWDALVKGDIDIYPEYTGTIKEEIMAGKGMRDDTAVRAFLARYGIRMTGPLGFNNNYALGMKRAAAKKYGIASISQLRTHPELIFGFSNEFMDRPDGW
ncbi:MAG: glycine betaine ABC transporter substrate-binding protein, partial [Syntrophorhabdales bacterium]